MKYISSGSKKGIMKGSHDKDNTFNFQFFFINIFVPFSFPSKRKKSNKP